MRTLPAAFIVGALLSMIAAPAAQAAPVGQTPAPSVTFNGEVMTTAYLGNVIYVGGTFTAAIVGGQEVARTRLAAVDANTGALLDWAPTADAKVVGIAADPDGVYLAGEFTRINGTRRDSLAKVDRTTGVLAAGFKHSLTGQPLTIAVGHGLVYLGGKFTAVDGQARLRLAAFDQPTGTLNSGWTPGAEDIVRYILPASDRVYLAGRFSTINGDSGSSKVAAVDPLTGAVDHSFNSSITAMVHKLALSGGMLYAGVGGEGGRATAMYLDGVAKWTVTTDGDVQAVGVLNDVVYLGGHFDRVCMSANVGVKGVCLDGSTRRIKLAAVNLNGDLLDWTANGNGSVGVNTISANPELGQVVAAGAFTTINGLTQNRFAIFNPGPTSVFADVLP